MRFLLSSFNPYTARQVSVPGQPAFYSKKLRLGGSRTYPGSFCPSATEWGAHPWLHKPCPLNPSFWKAICRAIHRTLCYHDDPWGAQNSTRVDTPCSKLSLPSTTWYSCR